jgi:hypothetical protein
MNEYNGKFCCLVLIFAEKTIFFQKNKKNFPSFRIPQIIFRGSVSLPKQQKSPLTVTLTEQEDI